jgi:hypothetical protein
MRRIRTRCRTRNIWVRSIKLMEIRILETTQIMKSGTIVPVRTVTRSINIRVIRPLRTIWIISLLILRLVCRLKRLIWISITWNIKLKSWWLNKRLSVSMFSVRRRRYRSLISRTFNRRGRDM